MFCSIPYSSHLHHIDHWISGPVAFRLRRGATANPQDRRLESYTWTISIVSVQSTGFRVSSAICLACRRLLSTNKRARFLLE